MTSPDLPALGPSLSLARLGMTVVVTVFATLGFAGLAAAAPPPSVGGGSSPQEACSGRSVGDACTLPNRQLGTCGQSTCNRLDYSGGSPPKAIEEACVVCQAGGASAPDDPMVGSGGPPEEGGQDTADSGAAAHSADTSEPPTSKSRCSVTTGGPGTLGEFGEFGLMLVLGGGLGLGARRRLRAR